MPTKIAVITLHEIPLFGSGWDTERNQKGREVFRMPSMPPDLFLKDSTDPRDQEIYQSTIEEFGDHLGHEIALLNELEQRRAEFNRIYVYFGPQTSDEDHNRKLFSWAARSIPKPQRSYVVYQEILPKLRPELDLPEHEGVPVLESKFGVAGLIEITRRFQRTGSLT